AQADQQARIGTLAAAVLGQPGYRTGDQPAVNVDGQAGFQGGSMEFRVRDLLSLTVEQRENGLVMLGTVAPQADDGLELHVETVGFQGMAYQGNKAAAVSQLFQLFQRIEYLDGIAAGLADLFGEAMGAFDSQGRFRMGLADTGDPDAGGDLDGPAVGLEQVAFDLPQQLAERRGDRIRLLAFDQHAAGIVTEPGQ